MNRLYPSKYQRGALTSLSVLVLFMLCVFIGLGSWQLQRKAEKEQILQSKENRGSQVTESLPLDLDEYASWRYRQVSIQGSYLDGRQLLLDNQIQQKKVGFNVFSPLQLSDGRVVLVDRGWLPHAEYRDQQPAVKVGNSLRTIEGYAYTPFSDGLRLGSVDNDQLSWPRMIQYIDYQQLQDVLGIGLIPVVIRLSPEASDGYLREWPVVAFGPERHLGYAVQWYALALAMVVIFLILIRRKDD